MADMNFFEAFGLSDDDFFADESKKEAAKKEVKKPAAKDGKKEPAKKAAAPKDFEVNLPLTVKARGFTEENFTVGTGTTAKASEVWDALLEKYPQFAIGSFDLIYVEEIKTVFVADGRIFDSGDESQAFPEVDDENPEGAKIIVTDGGISCELTPADFEEDGIEASEVTLGAVRDRFVAANPSYKGCKLHLEGGVAYPVISKPFTVKAGEIAEVTVGGACQQQEAGEGESLATKIAGEIAGVAPYLAKEGGAAFLSYRTAKGGNAKVYSKAATGSASEKPKAVEKKYALPLTLLVANFNMTYELSKDNFDGKEKVTKDEITKAMALREPLFGDADRKVEYLYNEGKNLMSCMFVSGKKGARP